MYHTVLEKRVVVKRVVDDVAGRPLHNRFAGISAHVVTSGP